MNGEYLKAMDEERFFAMAEPYINEVIKKPLDREKIAATIKPPLHKVKEKYYRLLLSTF